MNKHIWINGLLITACAFPAIAGRVDVVNENKKVLKIKIEAEGDKINEPLVSYIKEIPSDYHFYFLVDESDLKGKSHYSIKGATSAFAPGDKCQHLSVDKDYKVTFLNETIGTTCVAEEIP